MRTHFARRERLDALLLGVTPALATLPWPAPAHLIAVDWSSGMIRRAWPAQGLPAFAAVARGDWRQMPLRDASRDVAIGDGCYAALGSFGDCSALNDEVWRVLRRGGLYLLRCYLRPDPAPSLDRLFDDLRARRFGEFEIFIWRLAMALHGSARDGVRLGDIWRTWHERVPDTAALFARLGWSANAYGNIAQWRGATVAMPLPTLAEARALLEPRFELLECSYGTYEMGECCARLVLCRR